MNVYMTNGTLSFLKTLAKQNPTLNFFFMDNSGGTLIYYESNKRSIFAAGRKYEVMNTSGNIEETGYVAMNNIPLTEDGVILFEARLKQLQKQTDGATGLQALRLLKPKTGNIYIIFTQWRCKEDFHRWNTDKNHLESYMKQPAYTASKPFLTTYSMTNLDDKTK